MQRSGWMQWPARIAGALFVCQLLPAIAAPLPAERIAASLGTTVSAQGDVLRAAWPRDDVRVTVDRTPLPTAAGLTSWAAFTPVPQGAMVMADTVVFQDEVDAAMDAALAHGLRITALHNHFSFDQPRVLFLHFTGSGDAQTLARDVRAVWDAIRAARARHAIPVWGFGEPAPAAGTLDGRALSEILGVPVKSDGGVLKATIGRAARMDGVTVGDAMGLNTWAAFMGSDDEAVVDGDFIMLGDEVPAVLQALRKGGIHVVALHNHMIGEEPRFMFLHYWGAGRAADLARVISSALDAQQRAGRG